MKSSILLLLLVSILSVNAQQVSTLYYMEGVPLRHYLNPAFQSEYLFYISPPVIGFSQLGLGNNSFSLKDVVYKSGTNTVSFLNSPQAASKFYTQLNPTVSLDGEFQTNLLGFGFRYKTSYWTFGLTERLSVMAGLPKDLFKFAFYGTPRETADNKFDFTTLQTASTLYTEAALGYSKKINDHWLVGAKLKYLYGSADFSNRNKEIIFQANSERLSLNARGTLNASSPITIKVSSDDKSVSFEMPASYSDWIKPSGMGAGVDAGVVYKPDKKWSFSASLVDLGFIAWSKNVQNLNYSLNYTFDGVIHWNDNSLATFKNSIEKLQSGNYLSDSLLNSLKESIALSNSKNSYMTRTATRLNLGTEYKINEEFGVGLLSRMKFFKNSISQELTMSFNAHLFKFMDASIGTSFFDGKMNSVGAGLGLRLGCIHWFLASDYLPFQKLTIPSSVSGFGQTIILPYGTSYFNVASGFNFVFDTFENSLRKKKIKDAYRLGLENRAQTTPPNPAFNMPKSVVTKSKSHPVNKKGLHRKNANDDCHCNWN